MADVAEHPRIEAAIDMSRQLRARADAAMSKTAEIASKTAELLASLERHEWNVHPSRAALALEIEQLKQAVASRAVIEQAKGILMNAVGCDADRAFQLLKEQSQNTNRKLREIAAEIVASSRR